MSDSSVKTQSQKSNNSGSNETNSAFADAVQRARQLAAKIIHTGSDSNSITSGTKRPLEDNMNGIAEGTPDIKKMASSDPFGQGMNRNGSNSDFIVEDYHVPDKMVGLIIGRGGEQIHRLQSETGCKIQLASDSGGSSERQCTLTGPRETVQAVKEMINEIIRKANSPFPPEPGHISDGQYVTEMMIPGPKVGLLIGKGGENIRNLQEKGGVKMILIQDGPQQTAHDKPLRISGDPQKVEFAKQMVIDLLAQKEMERSYSNGGGPSNQEEIIVPRPAVGVVIGKGGDMIKRIQQDSGARVQFIQGKEDIPGDKLCQITGSMDQVAKASNMIRELINSVMMSGSGPGGGMGMAGPGRGRGRGRGGMGGPGGIRPDFGPGGPRMGRPGGNDGATEVQFPVPANKCGLVIGKGGETVRNINQQSGAHVEIARGAPPNPHEKVFVIRGNPQQIEHAKQLIMERVGGMPPGQGGPPGGPNMSGGPQGQYPGPPQYQQQYPPQAGPGQPYAPTGWAGGAYQAWPNQPTPAAVPVAPSDPAKVAADANAAAWAAYYAQFYNQPGQPQPQPGQMAPAQPAVQPAATAAAAPAQNSTGQADYSQAWVEYYRSLGMFREAEMIEQQSRGNQAPAGQAGNPVSTPGAPLTTPGIAPQVTTGASQPAPAGTPAAQPAAAPVAAAGYPGAYPAPGQQPQPAQVPYGQPAPYPGYNYAAAYGSQQQFQAAAPQ